MAGWVQVAVGDLPLASEVGAVLWNWALNLGACANSRSWITTLNSIAGPPGGVWRELENCNVRETYTFGARNVVSGENMFFLLLEGNFLNLIKGIYKKLTADITLNGRRLETLPLRSGTRRDAHSLHCYSTLCWRFQPEQSSKKKTLTKDIQTGTSICRWHDSIDRKSQRSQKKKKKKNPTKATNKFSKAAGYKINTQKLVVLSTEEVYRKNKISCASIHLQWTIQKGNSISKNKIPRNKARHSVIRPGTWD